MLTLNDALELPILERARVVAGAGGLTRSIRWVHTISVPDAADWLHGGELVLTTFFNMPDEPAAQCAFVRQLADSGIAAMVMTIGSLSDAIPDYLRRLGDELQLPLIELPYETRFVDVEKAINERISQQSLNDVRRALDIQQRLSQLVLEDGGFRELAEMLAELVGHSISIENERFEAIASRNIAQVDSARRYTLEYGRTNPQLIRALESEYLPKIRATLRPVHLPMMPQVGLEMERLLAPIVVHGEIYGYMWIIADVHALSPIDLMALEIGATVAALLMLYQESLHAAETSLKGNLIAQLIEGGGSRETILSDQALRYGLDLRLPCHMLVLSIQAGHPTPISSAYRLINQTLAQNDIPAVAAPFAGQIVILVQASQAVDALAAALLQRLAQDSLKIGISMRFSTAAQVSRAHQQCREVLDIMQRLASPAAVQHFADLGYLHTLFYAGRGSLQQNPNVPILRRLAEAQSDLFYTLEAYLDAGGNSVQASKRLHIHRSTMNYRLARIKERCNIDLSSPQTRINLQVAIKLMRLFDELPPG